MPTSADSVTVLTFLVPALAEVASRVTPAHLVVSIVAGVTLDTISKARVVCPGC